MADIISMPKLGFDMAEGTLVRWAKKEGDKVEKGELLAEIETDKATVEVESQYSGVVLKHLVAEGAAVPVGRPIAAVGAAGETVDASALAGAGAAKEEKKIDKSTNQLIDQSINRLTDQETGPKTAPIPEGSSDGNGNLPGGVRASPLARKLAEER
ncbi:MAG TPA: biotin/lipoyl-containing protein, partial [Anaerolineales bacterium]